MTAQDLAAAVYPFALDRYGARLSVREFEGAVALAQERAITLVQIADQMAFLFVPDDEFTIDEASWAKVARLERVDEFFDAAIKHLEHCDWVALGGPEAIDLRPVMQAIDAPKGMIKAVFVATQGRDVGLPAFDAIELLGRDRALRRFRDARARL